MKNIMKNIIKITQNLSPESENMWNHPDLDGNWVETSAMIEAPTPPGSSFRGEVAGSTEAAATSCGVP